MKRIYALLAAVALLGSCAKDFSQEVNLGNGDQTTITVTLGDPARSDVSGSDFELVESGLSRTTLSGMQTFWTSTDVIGIVAFNAEGTAVVSNEPYTIATGEGTKTATFTGPALVTGTKYRAYYPYSASAIVENKITFTSLRPTVPQSTSGNTDHLSGIDYLYSDPVTASASTANFVFHHAMAMLELRVTLRNADGTSVTLEGCDLNAGVGGFATYFTLGSEGAPALANNYYTQTWLELAPYTFTGNGDRYVGYAPLCPLNATGKMRIVLKVLQGAQGGTFIVEKSVPTGGFVAGSYYTCTFDLDASEIYSMPYPVNIDNEAQTIGIATAADLRWLSAFSRGELSESSSGGVTSTNFSGYTITLLDDIDISGEEWIPIDFLGGIFDGAGKTISGMTVTSEDKEYQGLISMVTQYGVVRNVIIGAGAIQGEAYIGAIAGQNNGIIENCINNGCSAVTTNYIKTTGNIVGVNNNIVRACVNYAAIGEFAGGIVGGNYGKVLVCMNRASLASSPFAAGLVTYNGAGGLILSCISATESYFLNSSSYAFAWVCGNATNGQVFNCYAPNSTAYIGMLPAATTLNTYYLNTGSSGRLYYYGTPAEISVDNLCDQNSLVATFLAGWTWSTTDRDAAGFPLIVQL